MAESTNIESDTLTVELITKCKKHADSIRQDEYMEVYDDQMNRYFICHPVHGFLTKEMYNFLVNRINNDRKRADI